MGKKNTRVFNDSDLIDIKTLYESGQNTYAIAERYACDASTVQDWLKRIGVEIRGNAASKRLYRLRENAFERIEDEQTAYWLGFLFADGCVSEKRGCWTTGLVLSKRDEGHLGKFLDFLESDYPLKKDSRYETIGVHLYSTKLAANLIKLGCTPRKSATLTFPDISIPLISHFVRGYFDGDGSAWGAGKYKSLHLKFVGNKNFLECLGYIIHTLVGTSPTLEKHYKSEIVYYLKYSGQFKAHCVARWMYEDATVWLDRKREIIDSCPQGKRLGYPTVNTYIGTAGAVSAETSKRYIEECQGK